ncbi:MAG: orotidine-5'-phosphate decarboxylase [Candidatus Omnitrophica bacterium]|nr:orotidine-5'-phosphate decarboxylase [Candidatus Omnitrophota bacterium]
MKTKLIVALDVDSFSKAKAIVNRLGPCVRAYKVGSQLFIASGIEIVLWLKRKHKNVFLDLKLHDIPNTVAASARQITKLGVYMFTIHATGGKVMMRGCVKAVRSEASRLKIKKPAVLAVTVLTSQKSTNTKRDVLRLAKEALSCGVDGIVCSVEEAHLLHRKLKHKFILVCPGIRSATNKKSDQKRIATPQQAKKAQVDFIVVGRPIIEAPSASLAAVNILNALKER